MTGLDWVVIVAGAAGIVLVNWYFLFSERKAVTATESASGTQEIGIVVQGGYDPAVIHVTAGKPVRLRFDRRETSGCSEEIVFPSLGIRKFLPAFQETSIDLDLPGAGTYEFTCGMSMLHGKVIAE